MAAKKKKKKPGKTFRFQMSLGGIVGIGVVCFCLFLWMFLLGIWAGQTILLPSAKPGGKRPVAEMKTGSQAETVRTIESGAKKIPAPAVGDE